MKRSRMIIIIRSVIAALLLCLSIAGFVGGRPVMGLLFLLLAGANVALTLTMHRRRSELAQRLPGLAARTGAAPLLNPATPPTPAA